MLLLQIFLEILLIVGGLIKVLFNLYTAQDFYGGVIPLRILCGVWINQIM
jgi:hypothetical protein